MQWISGGGLCAGVQAMLRAHRDALDAGQAMLLDQEVIFGEDVEQVIATHPPSEPVPPPLDSNGNGNGTALSSLGSNGAGLPVPVSSRT